MTALQKPFDLFSTPSHAWATYTRLRYNPAAIDTATGRPAKLGTPESQIAVMVRANSLAIVSHPAPVPDETITTAWHAPCFTDESGTTHWVFSTHFGSLDRDIISYHLRSWDPFPYGFLRMERFVSLPFPGNGLTWERPPTYPRVHLPKLPAVILEALAKEGL